MVELNSLQSALFAKYWGRADLVNDEEFWQDVFVYYSNEAIAGSAPMPLKFNPYSVRMVREWLDCSPGQCGKCCHRYDVIQLNCNDFTRIAEHTSYTKEDLRKITTITEGLPALSTKKGCPFLKKNRCTIYKFRPDACYMFPFNGRDAVLDGKPAKQMRIRLICKPALAVARKIITDIMSKDKILLPDLTVIPKE